ncbi:hypothetical protein ILYODFUR_022371 [Ilyodon furcidens]|uniref:Uncharacterized protein n=1 Tax=Ilyodon furcidens TaxID=33524 RepID=A0ABV0TWR6_9TELE
MPKAQRHFQNKHPSNSSLPPQPWQSLAISGQKPQHPARPTQPEVVSCHPFVERDMAHLCHSQFIFHTLFSSLGHAFPFRAGIFSTPLHSDECQKAEHYVLSSWSHANPVAY